MKIRTGFVSNSSSSSFVLIVEEEHFKDLMKEAHPYLKAMAEQLGSKTDVLGTPSMVFGGLTAQDGESWLTYSEIEFEGDKGKYEDEEDGGKWEAWEALEKLFRIDWKSRSDKTPNPKVFYHSEDG